ncbi:MAG: DUF4416 family protein [Dissulfurispiraceae bacterium]
MGTPHNPSKALLFIGALFQQTGYYLEARHALEKMFGEIVMESSPIQWNFSDYYADEMGEPLYKKFIFFKKLVSQEDIASIKLMTNATESEFSRAGKRKINLDPGYLTSAKIVLASTKDYSHRIYLRDGIYGEVTLIFKRGRFTAHLNTYKDYLDERYFMVFAVARKLLSLLSSIEPGMM